MLAILTLLMLVVILVGASQQAQNGGAPFSGIGQHIGQGISGSYSNIVNGPDPTKQMIHPTKNPLPTYYGHGIPLQPVQPGPFDSPPITPHNLNAKCSPECCPSPYSCDHGCLCVDQRGLRHGNKK